MLGQQDRLASWVVGLVEQNLLVDQDLPITILLLLAFLFHRLGTRAHFLTLRLPLWGRLGLLGWRFALDTSLPRLRANLLGLELRFGLGGSFSFLR